MRFNLVSVVTLLGLVSLCLSQLAQQRKEEDGERQLGGLGGLLGGLAGGNAAGLDGAAGGALAGAFAGKGLQDIIKQLRKILGKGGKGEGGKGLFGVFGKGTLDDFGKGEDGKDGKGKGPLDDFGKGEDGK